MNIKLLLNGNLEMSCTNKKEQRALKKEFGFSATSATSIGAEGSFIRKILEPMGYHSTLPEEHGYLTSAPLITNGKDVWGYMDYQVRSFIEELINGNKIIWQKG